MVQDSRSASYPGAAIASSYDFGSIDSMSLALAGGWTLAGQLQVDTDSDSEGPGGPPAAAAGARAAKISAEKQDSERAQTRGAKKNNDTKS